MRHFIRLSIWVACLALIVLLTSCDEGLANEPSPVSTEQVALQIPTRTLGPIVSFTPRFTATPIPSATFTPSATPIPTDTPVPPTHTPTDTPTLTPTVEGVIRSTENVNLREGPGINYDIVRSVSPGTDLGILGVQTDARGREWYKVAYTDDDGEVLHAWVFAALIDTDFESLVGLTETPPATSAAAPTVVPNRVDILAYCQQKGVRPPSPKTSDNVFIEWSWYVSHPEYMDDHLEHATYDVHLDGKPLENWTRFATDMKLEAGVYIIYWYYPVGQLDPGEHRVDFRLTWDTSITDGYAQFGPGTAREVDEGSCTFTVIKP